MGDCERLFLRVAGAISGGVYLDSLQSTVLQLREELARLLGTSEHESFRVICAGRLLQDPNKTLAECGLTPNSKLLVTLGASGTASMVEADKKSRRVEKLKAAAQRLASRGELTHEWDLSLENQDGTDIRLDPEERKAVVMGLALHEQGRATMRRGNHSLAMEELLAAEEVLASVNSPLLEHADNLGVLMIDIVWCAYHLQDLSRLAISGERLTKARRVLEKAHGPNMERVRRVHGAVSPEVALYVRLETLEGVVAYYMQDHSRAKSLLTSAQQNWQRLQPSEEAVARLCEMGYLPILATRALRFCGGDVGAAVAFLDEERKKTEAQRKKQRRLKAWRKERVGYGKTAGGNYVDQDQLDKLCALGYRRVLAAEALRGQENDGDRALDLLVQPIKRRELELALKMKEAAQQVFEAPLNASSTSSPVAMLTALGYKEVYVRHALRQSTDNYDAALVMLNSWGPLVKEEQDWSSILGTCSMGEGTSTELDPTGIEELEGRGPPDPVDQGGAAGPSAPPLTLPPPGATSSMEALDQSDMELEDELVTEVGATGKDPLAAYDISVEEEGEILTKYLSLLESPSDGRAAGPEGSARA